jgi:riboflavin biosynthesis pyrimidine reductase
MSTSRPRVLVNFASSIDGKITLAPGLRQGPFTMSRHHEDARRMRQIRARADAIVIGASSIRTDDPDLAIDAKERMRRRDAGEREPMRMVVTGTGEGIHTRQKMFDPALGGASFVLHGERMSVETKERLGGWAVERGIKTLLCEGGGTLCAQFFAARAVDELFVTLVPRILGGAQAPSLAEGPGFGSDEIPDATLGSIERFGDELLLRYDFRWR